MKILHAYVLRGILLNFFVGLALFVTVLLLGHMFKIANLIMHGVPLKDIALLFAYLLPYFLSACIPMSLLSSILLVFGRLSQDNEIVAMKASGVSILQISYPLWIIGSIATLICFKINNEIIPYSHFAARKLLVEMGSKNPTAYLEPGNFVEIFPRHIIYVRERHGDVLKKIVIYQSLGQGHVKTITAQEGQISYDSESKQVLLELKNGAIQEPSGKDFFNLQFGTYALKLDASKVFQDTDNLGKKHKDMTIREIKKKIVEYKGKGINTTPLLTEIQKKISISFSCLVFTLIGIPLGIRTHRSEKTVGIAISLLLVFLYYLLIIFGKALDEKTAFHPEYLMWLPNVLVMGIGLYLFRKVSK